MDPYDSPLRSPIVVPITHARFPTKNQTVEEVLVNHESSLIGMFLGFCSRVSCGSLGCL